jgi:drug/metabolite transporter (DMT)-like permease
VGSGDGVGVVIGTALGGALFVAVGFVIQQHAAAQAPPDERLSFRLLLRLVRRPLWLGGIATMAAGQLLGAIALDKGSLGLVEPLMATNLLFALPLSALWHRRRLGVREWAGAFILIGGLAAFIAAGDPHGGNSTHLPWPNWVMSGGSIILLATVLVLVGKRRPPATQATLLASAAGALYGLQDALTQRTTAEFSHGFLALVLSWPVFCLVAVAVFGILLAQSAFEAAPLGASLPAITVAEPITGIAFGAGVYGDHITLSGYLLGIELLGFAAMVVGVFLVAASPLVTGNSQTPEAENRELDRVP